MPEAPDLEAIRAVLNRECAGRTITRVEVRSGTVIRLPVAAFTARLTGRTLGPVMRRGKFLIFAFETADRLVVNQMLVGRWQLTAPATKRPARTQFVLHLSDGRELRYIDARVMGKVYLVEAGHLDQVPQFAEMGPDLLDPALTETVFLERLRRYRGQVKNVLVNHQFVAGIGNAYADEILFEAGIHPFAKVSGLAADRRRALYAALRSVMAWAIPEVAARMGDATDEKPRDFLRVHRKGGEPCSRCGTRISEISPQQRVTSFCRTCQPA